MFPLTYFIYLDLNLPLQVAGDLLHVLNTVDWKVAVRQKDAAETLQSSARRGHVPALPVFHWLQENALNCGVKRNKGGWKIVETYEPGQRGAEEGKQQQHRGHRSWMLSHRVTVQICGLFTSQSVVESHDVSARSSLYLPP